MKPKESKRKKVMILKTNIIKRTNEVRSSFFFFSKENNLQSKQKQHKLAPQLEKVSPYIFWTLKLCKKIF